jgi:hypothetical protein
MIRQIIIFLIVAVPVFSGAMGNKPWKIYRRGKVTAVEQQKEASVIPAAEALDDDLIGGGSGSVVLNSSGPWQIFRPGQKEAEAQMKKEQQQRFEAMHLNSQLKQVCQAEPNTHHCAKIAELLYCAQSGWGLRHLRRCGRRRAKDDNYIYESRAIFDLARVKGLTPQRATQEIELFVSTIKQLAGDK